MRATGIDVIGSAPWGTHFCQFYETAQDLVDTLVPYFAAGLAQNEFCTWITSEPLRVEGAKAALEATVGDLEPYLRSGQLEILDYREWYTLGGTFDAGRVLRGWVDKLVAAQAKGFQGLRLTGNTFWLEQADWQDFTDYEAAIDRVIGQYQMLAMCTYSLAKCGAPELLDVMANHAFALIKRGGSWQIIESAERRRAEDALREARDELELRVRERTAELEQANASLQRENRERLRTEALLRLEGGRLDALLQLSQMSEAPLPEITAFTLEQAIALTGSKIGFVGFLNEDESVYTLHAVSKDVVKECRVAGDPVQWHLADAGIWADAIRDRTSLFVNDYSGPHPRKRGFPPGHPYVERFLVVPILEGERITAVAGVGNKESDYDKSDERQIRLLLSGMCGCVQRNRSRDELQKAYHELEAKVERRTAQLAASTAALQESLDRLNRAEAIAHLGSWELDLRTSRLSWSDEVYRIFGCQPQDFGATYEAFLEAVHPDDRAAVDDAYTGSLREGKASYEIEHRIVRRPTGEVRWVHERCEHIRDADDHIVRSVGMVLDITERKLAERDRERMTRDLLVAERARAALAEKLVSETNHRTRNNLAIVTGLLQMQVGLLPAGSPAAGHLRDAVARICTFSVLHGQLYERGEDQVELVEGLRRVARVAEEALSKSGTEITVSGEAFLCPTQAATNLCVAANELITNALKYGEPDASGRLRIEILLSREDGRLKLSVWNSGRPIARDFTDKRGATLGLSIVEDLAAARYGGSFTLQPRAHGNEATIEVEERRLFGDQARHNERRHDA
jgi:PAS domain S-box-containing protein